MDMGMTRRRFAAVAGLGAGFHAFSLRADSPDEIAIEVGGAVDEPRSWTVAELGAMPTVEVSPSRAGGDGRPETARGPLLYDLLMTSRPRMSGEDAGRFIELAIAEDGFVSSVAWAEIDPVLQGQQAIVSIENDGAPLSEEVGPAYLIVPEDRRGDRGVFKLRRLEVVDPANWLLVAATPTP